MSKRQFFGLWVLASLLFPHSGLAATEMVVIGSTGTDLFSEGKIIDSDQMIDVPDGTSVTLMDEAGTVITVRGPYSAAVGSGKSGEDHGLVELVSALFTEHPTFPMGAFRGLPTGKLVDPWVIDASTPGDKCIRAKDGAVLWQPGYSSQSVLRLTHVAAVKTAEIRWPAGAATLAWPREIPLEQDTHYEAKLTYQIQPNRFVLHIAEDSLPQDTGAVAWMVRSGCYAQAKALLGVLPADKVIDASGSGG